MKQETGRRLILITWKEVILHPGEGGAGGGWGGDMIAMSAYSDMQNNHLVAAASLESAAQFVAV